MGAPLAALTSLWTLAVNLWCLGSATGAIDGNEHTSCRATAASEDSCFPAKVFTGGTRAGASIGTLGVNGGSLEDLAYVHKGIGRCSFPLPAAAARAPFPAMVFIGRAHDGEHMRTLGGNCGRLVGLVEAPQHFGRSSCLPPVVATGAYIPAKHAYDTPHPGAHMEPLGGKWRCLAAQLQSVDGARRTATFSPEVAQHPQFPAKHSYSSPHPAARMEPLGGNWQRVVEQLWRVEGAWRTSTCSPEVPQQPQFPAKHAYSSPHAAVHMDTLGVNRRHVDALVGREE